MSQLIHTFLIDNSKPVLKRVCFISFSNEVNVQQVKMTEIRAIFSEKFKKPIYMLSLQGLPTIHLIPFICETEISIIQNRMWLLTLVDYIAM